jgi:hypothetical protein
MLYNSCMGISWRKGKFGNNTYPQRIRRRSNLGHIFQGKKCDLWAGKYGICHRSGCLKICNIIFETLTWGEFHLQNFL